MAERRIQLIMEWIEANPKVFEKVKEKVAELGAATKQAAKVSLGTVGTAEQQETALQAVRDAYGEQLTNIMRTLPGFKMAEAVQQKIIAREKAWQANLQKTGDRLRKVGAHVGFYGWIISFAARSMIRMLRQVFTIFTDVIKVSAEWPDSLEKVATAMALLSSQGLLTSETANLLQDTMNRLIEQGPAFEALWSGFQAIFLSLATIITSEMLPSLTNLLNTLTAFLARTDVQRLLIDLGNAIISLMESIIPALPNLLIMIKLILDFVNALRPLFPILVPLIPLVLALGTALWVLGPILSILGSILGVVSVSMSGVMVTIGGFTAALGSFGLAIGGTVIGLGPLGLIIGAIAAAIVGIYLVWQHWGEIVDWFNKNVITPLRPILEPIGNLIQSIGNVVYQAGRVFYEFGRVAVAMIGIALKPLADALKPVWTFFELIRTILGVIGAIIWEQIRPVVEWFTNALNGLSNALSGAADWLRNIGDALGKLCFRHATPFVETFNDVIGQATQQTANLYDEVTNLSGALRGIPTAEVGIGGGIGGAATQNVTISVPITIENVSAEVDIVEMTRKVSQSIAEELRRKAI